MATITFKTKVSTASITDQHTDSIAWVLEQDFISSHPLITLATKYFPTLQQTMSKQKFTGKPLSTLVVPAFIDGKVVDLIFVGLGKPEAKAHGSIDREMYRRALGSLVRIVEARKGTSLAFRLPDHALFGMSERELAKQTTITLQMAAYHFDEFITDADRKLKDLTQITLVSEHNSPDVQQGVQEGLIIGQAVNTCRYWIDMPPERATPHDLANHARDIAKDNNLKFTLFNEAEIIKMGMGGLAAVSKGSERDCHLLIMEYAHTSGAPTVALVGKGITFDSGGLSLKPANYMETMKEDMSGAAAVIAIMSVIAKLKPAINVIGVTPLSENLPSGKATKPGDIATFYNGKTAEIKNTDAEGRLILADALSYTVKHYNPDAIIDLATLTGSVLHALGPHFTGIMSQHEQLFEQVMQAGRVAGDQMWRLPLPDDYKVAIKSPVADLCNSGNAKYKAGAITAGLFLQNFVGDVPWVHLDIAGTAFDVPDISYYRPEGATGVGVRSMIELIMNWK